MSKPVGNKADRIEDIRETVAMTGLRAALAQLRTACVCLIVDPCHKAACRELGKVLLAGIQGGLKPGTLVRAYAEEVQSHAEELALRLESDVGDELDVRASAVRLTQTADALTAYMRKSSGVEHAWCTSDDDLERLLIGPPKRQQLKSRSASMRKWRSCTADVIRPETWSSSEGFAPPDPFALALAHVRVARRRRWLSNGSWGPPPNRGWMRPARRK